MPCVGSPLQATDDDVQYAYRLLLGREPDNAGYRGICDWVRKGSVGTLEPARNFMMSAEFRAAQGFGGGCVKWTWMASSSFHGRAIR